MKRILIILGGALLAWTWATPQAHGYGYWDCRRYGWWAGTTHRSMNGATKFECGGLCNDASHTQPESWVDISGGISNKCDDHSDSFYGPIAGEWNGCTVFGGPSSQASSGLRTIESVDQGWDRWPSAWYSGHYYMDDMSFYNDYTASMNHPFASIYDLDMCFHKDIFGTIYYPNFPVTSRLKSGDPSDPYYGYARWDINGATGTSCSTVSSWCENQVCSDLHVASSFECFYVEECDPWDPWSYCDYY
jgi:hypothetical protein